MMRLFIFGCLIALLVWPGWGSGTALAESDPDDKELSKVELNTQYFKSIFTDTGYILTSPLRWELEDWGKVSLVLGTTGALIAADEDIRTFFQDHRGDTSNDVSGVFERFGNSVVLPSGLASFYIFGTLAENEKAQRVGLLGLESFIVTLGLTLGMKYAASRSRPDTGDSATVWNGFDDSTRNHSFPSGHSSGAFAVATVFANEYEKRPWVPPLAYGVATLTALSRVHDDRHWMSDVFFGSALGYFTAKTILYLHKDGKTPDYMIYPKIDARQVGALFVRRF